MAETRAIFAGTLHGWGQVSFRVQCGLMGTFQLAGFLWGAFANHAGKWSGSGSGDLTGAAITNGR
jgi:hypothetical protein